jgi:8-oxo-dGTP pyrophosphatase MutT (NUDIX family)
MITLLFKFAQMYEVFFNDRRIVIAAPGKITISKSTQTIDNLATTEAVKVWFIQFAESNSTEIVLLAPSPELFFETVFQPAFYSIPAAGGVVIRTGKILFIFRNKKWDLPKGKIDAGETPREAALREVAEECGIAGHKIEKQLPSTFHIFKSPYKKLPGEWIFKETFWFEMEYLAAENGTPQTEENITEIRWFQSDNLGTVLANTYANLRRIILLYK